MLTTDAARSHRRLNIQRYPIAITATIAAASKRMNSVIPYHVFKNSPIENTLLYPFCKYLALLLLRGRKARKKTNPNFPTPSARAQTPKIKRARRLNLSREYKAPKKLKRRSLSIRHFRERPFPISYGEESRPAG